MRVGVNGGCLRPPGHWQSEAQELLDPRTRGRIGLGSSRPRPVEPQNRTLESGGTKPHPAGRRENVHCEGTAGPGFVVLRAAACSSRLYRCVARYPRDCDCDSPESSVSRRRQAVRERDRSSLRAAVAGTVVRQSVGSHMVRHGIFNPSALTVLSSGTAFPSFFVTTPNPPL